MRIELKRGEFTAVVETMGAELVSFRDGDGTEYIWGGDPKSWAGQNPNLFPIVGNLKDGKMRMDGRTYEMPRHGFARRSEFTLFQRGEDYVVLALRQSQETLKQYFCHFELRIRHELTDSGFSTQFEVRNEGGGELPYCVGGHTGFNCPLRPGERFEDYRLVFDEVEDADTLILNDKGCLTHKRERILDHTDTICLDHAIFDRLDTLIFEGLRSKGVTLQHKDGGRAVHMDFGEFPMVAFWTMPRANAPYICLEPWHGCAAYEDESGEFLDKPHVIKLSYGLKRLKYTVELR